MAQELIYTSVEKGLRPGTRGFCTVACTRGMLPAAIHTLESLSVLRELYPAGSGLYEQNPVAFSHYQCSLLGRSKTILSRIAVAPPDPTGRSNKLAHHILLNLAERTPEGPANVAKQSGQFITSWTQEPRYLEEVRPFCPQKQPLGSAWENLTGDEGYAALLADAFLQRPSVPVYILFTPGTDVLSLFDESIALLPQSQRWNVTFSTFYSKVPPGIVCQWRALEDSDDNRRSLACSPNATVLNLNALPVLHNSASVGAARRLSGEKQP